MEGDDPSSRLLPHSSSSDHHLDGLNNNMSNNMLHILNSSYLNLTENITDYPSGPPAVGFWSAVFAALYTLICLTGLLGNGLVIFVVIRYAKMKTVTNMYILNLAVADLCFLIGLPFLIFTLILKHWIFGFAICKLFYISTSINWYTSVFTLTAMSADRYMAICHPIPAMRYRTPIVSRVVCACVWTASLLAMLPIVLYTTTVDNGVGGVSCTIMWPPNGSIPGEKLFIWYALLLGFAAPVLLISVFYALVVLRLQTVGPKKKGKNKSHRKVTQMVLTVITVYVVCWLPYWVFQIVLNYASSMPWWSMPLFQGITIMSYANSMMNPVLYAFLSDNFRKSFTKAFKCATDSEINAALNAEQSCAVPGGKRNKHHTKGAVTSVITLQKTKCMVSDDEEDEEVLQALATSSQNGTSTTRLENSSVGGGSTGNAGCKSAGGQSAYGMTAVNGGTTSLGGGVYIGPPVDAAEENITEKTGLKYDTNNVTVL